MNADQAVGFLSAIRCVHLEAEQWAKLAREKLGTREGAVATAVAEAMLDTVKRMSESLVKAGEAPPQEVLRL